MNEQEQTIDLRVLLNTLREHILPIAAITLAAAIFGFVLAAAVIPKKYTSEALMYVENSAAKSADSSININDITAAQKLVNTCQILFTSDYILGQLSDSFNGRYTGDELEKMITITSVNNTEVLRISVETHNADESYLIALKLTELAKTEFERIIKNGSIETVSEPTYPIKHNYPSAVRFTAAAFIIGFAFSYFIFLIIDMTDVKVKPDDDLAQIYNIPVFAEILDFETANGSHGKYSGYSGYDYRSADRDRKKSSGDDKDGGGTDGYPENEDGTPTADDLTEIEKISAKLNSENAG